MEQEDKFTIKLMNDNDYTGELNANTEYNVLIVGQDGKIIYLYNT